ASWDQTWQGALDQAPPDLEAPSLENDIDRLKLEFLAPLLPRNGRAVEIGCGSARLLARVGKTAPLELYAVDTASAALALARATSQMIGIPIHTVDSDARRLAVDTGAFDVVLSGGLLEHFPDPRPVLSEMVRILKPGALFYADVVPRKLSLYRRREWHRMRRSPWMLPGVYESDLGTAYYEKTLAELGCTEVVSRWCGVYPQHRARTWLPKTENLDGTLVARLVGWYFMLSARKA